VIDDLRWAQVKDIVYGALAVDAEQRSRFLEERCGSDASLRTEVEALLGFEEKARMSFLNSPLIETAFSESGAGTLVAGRVLAERYTLVRQLGEGGMGQVWLAEQREPVRRQVALKLPFISAATARLETRFARERDILASLSHPNIGHLYDAGVTPQGQPFLAMEFVAGESLTEYCRGRGLTVPQRVTLFLQVLSAVQYAHAQNVIHRDLKPSNILVREEDQVVLLDFGIAKLLVEGEAQETALTLFNGAPLTPDYASPEQIRGETLRPATDIYSLGVVLYELLSGQRPYVLERSTRRDLEEAILAADPPRPSDVVTSLGKSGAFDGAWVTTRNALRGDVDTIILKALKKSPEDRYASADAFAEDLRRHLRHEAVSAQPDTVWYRLARRAQRHRTGLVTGGLAITLTAVAMAYVVDERVLRSHAPVSGAADTFSPPPRSIAVLPFVNLSHDASQDYFSDGLSEELLDRLSQLRELQVAARTSSFSFKGQNVDVRSIAHKLNVATILEGSVRRDGDMVKVSSRMIDAKTGFQVWSENIERSYADTLAVEADVATAVAQRLVGPRVADEVPRIELGGTDNMQAYDAYLRGLHSYYATNAGESDYRTALAGFDQAIALDPRYALAYARRASALLRIYNVTDDTSQRQRLHEEARDAAQRAVALAPQLGEAHLAMAFSYGIGAYDFVASGHEFERALALAPGSAWVQGNFATFASQVGQHEVALRAANRAVQLDPQNPVPRQMLAWVLIGARRFREVIVAVQHARALDPASTWNDAMLINALLGLGQFEQARRDCESRSTLLQANLRQYCLAIAYHGLNRQSDAESHLNALKALDGEDSAFAYAEIYSLWGDKATALDWLSKAADRFDPNMETLRINWKLDPLRAEPRFQAIEARIKYPSERET
jgi:serine/threonine protein kinase/Tfp pilus assembly protein PilF